MIDSMRRCLPFPQALKIQKAITKEPPNAVMSSDGVVKKIGVQKLRIHEAFDGVVNGLTA
jgi:hypothetical protein